METTFYISTDKSLLDIDMIHDFLSNRSYWAKGRTRETVEKSIAGSLCFGVFDAENEQAGFARVVSDYAMFGWLLDVFVLEDFRGKGLGKMLMSAVIGHNDLQGIQRWGLDTMDAHGLYEKYGFKPLARPERRMELIR